MGIIFLIFIFLLCLWFFGYRKVTSDYEIFVGLKNTGEGVLQCDECLDKIKKSDNYRLGNNGFVLCQECYLKWLK